MIGSWLDTFTFDYLLNQCLNDVPDGLDKRQGSIIYDALAPACQRLAELYQNIRTVYQDTFADTALGDALKYRAAEAGVDKYLATYAVKKVYFADSSESPMSIPLGFRVSTISDINPIIYIITEAYTVDDEVQPGYYKALCETVGTVGNEYSGPMTNITNMSGIAAITMSDLIIPARDDETDDVLRIRYFDAVRKKAFGGNIAQYDQEVKKIAGVGEVQIYPVWNGGGTVKISIIDTEYNECSSEFITSVQLVIDPENASGDTGTGLGVAPIGHKVTVVTPSVYTANISATLVLNSGVTVNQVQSAIEDAIEEYIASLRKLWGVPDELNRYFLSIYISKITVAILSVTGVANVTNVKINDVASDVTLTEDATTQQLPKLGTVSLDV
jgi:uncharacterized phage protein gp47/JayE